MMAYEHQFLNALWLTLITEIPILIFFIHFIYKKSRYNVWYIIFIGTIASSLTLPYLWFVLPAYVFNRIILIVCGEGLVVLIEMFIYQQLLKLKLVQSLIVSLVANMASIMVGLILAK